MNHYRYSQKIHKRGKRVRRTRRALVAFVVIFLIGGGVLLFDILKQTLSNDSAGSTSSTAAVQSATVNIFRTPYYQFQADKSWREVNSSDNVPDRFVYRSYQGTLVHEELIIEVNREKPIVLDNNQVTRVLPVDVSSEGALLPLGEVSSHCKEFAKGIEQQFVTYKNVTFPCTPDGNNFMAVVGSTESNFPIRVTTADGSIRTYSITYQDSRFSPSGRSLNDIVKTFRLILN